MLIILLAYFGGVLTILSPCILPVLPFVFARADRGFVRGALPLLVGMALTFAAVATLAAVGGGWAVRANEVGRWLALHCSLRSASPLIFPTISDRMTRRGWHSARAARSRRRGGSANRPGGDSVGSSLCSAPPRAAVVAVRRRSSASSSPPRRSRARP